MLSNKVILLTGGGDGIGWECAKAYAKAGALVCIADKSPENRDKLSLLNGHGHQYLVCDISSENEVKSLFDIISDKFKRLDAIHNNAAIAHPSQPLHATTDEQWDTLFNVNVKSILLTTKHGIDLLKLSKGTILNTGSLVASIGQDNHAAYVATKGAVNALTKAMALDYAHWGVRVNAIAPAAVKTPMLEAWIKEQPQPDEMVKYLDNLQPLGRMPGGDVIADVAIFLLSDSARFITGCILPVSGGAELGYRKLL